jgi:phenylacetate-coenzyme A ligase PaaK-like adenylate-forming protein
MSRRVAQSLSVGVHRVLRVPVTTPIDELVGRLNHFRPQSLNGFPSTMALLAEEQRAGRLRITPELISTSSELLTPETAARIEDAFGVRPFNLYATTEGLWGADCAEHDGIHLFEDMTLVENVDARGEAVPDGRPGAQLLVTNLCNFTQPLIRLAVADSVTIAPEPCACGRTLRRVQSIAGRSDDVLTLAGIPVLPLHFGVVARDRDVIEFQVEQTGPAAVRVLVVARGEVDDRLRAALTSRLLELGVREPVVEIERRTNLPRPASGKLQLVKALRT